MNDLISRQAALDMAYAYGNGLEPEGYCVNVEDIQALPPAQPEIIRCKDCKWYGRVDKRRFYRGMDCLQKRIDTIIPDEDFCSRAERREE